MPDKTITGTATVGGTGYPFSLTVSTTVPGDTTAPVLSSPAASATGPSSAQGSVNSNDGEGQLYAYFSENSTVPGATDAERKQNLKNGVGAAMLAVRDVTASGAQTVTIAAGLLASTSYYAHYLHTDVAGNNSHIATSPAFTTAPAVSGSVPQVAPSSNWGGTAASGFSTQPTTTQDRALLDPARPALRLFFADRAAFVSGTTHRVYFSAFALDVDGTVLNNNGIDRIEINYEGGITNITTAAIHTYVDINGTTRTVEGFAVDLVHTGNGAAVLYATAYPRDPSKHPRTIGPFYYFPSQALTQGTLELNATLSEIPTQRYKTIQAAGDYAASQNWHTVILNNTDPGAIYDPQDGSSSFANDGRMIIQGSQPFEIGQTGQVYTNLGLFHSVYRATRMNLAAGFPMKYHHVEFRGSNCTVNFRFMFNFNVPSVNFNGCHITRGNKSEMYAMGADPLAKLNHEANDTFLRDFTASHCHEVGKQVEAVVNGVLSDGSGDMFSGAKLIYGNRVERWGKDVHGKFRHSFKIAYTGGQASPSISWATGGSLVTLKAGGTTHGTYNLYGGTWGFPDATDNYRFSHLVAWINTLPGWSASVDDDSLRGNYISNGTSNNKQKPFTDWPVSTNGGAPTQMWSFMDMHSDFMAQNNHFENQITHNNVTCAQAGQITYWIGNPAGAKDFMAINNVWDSVPDYVNSPFQQIAVGVSHLVFLHNSFTTQNNKVYGGGNLGDGLSRSCAYACNTFPAMILVDTSITSQKLGVMDDNHLHTGNSVNQKVTDAGFVWSVGGNMSTCFPGFAIRNFTPGGALASNKHPRRVRFDLNGNERADLDAAGAVRA